MNSSQAGSFFHGFADTFDTFYEGKRSPLMQWVDRRFRSDMFIRYQWTFERLGSLAGRRGIDIGCGSGHYVAEALQRGAAHVVALDPAPRMIDLTRTRVQRLRALDRATLFDGYFPGTAPPGPFDFAIVMGVMDYVAEPVEFLQALRQCLSGGAMPGTASVSFPSRHWLRGPLRKVRYRLRHCPLYLYDEPQIRDLGRQAGFRTTDVMKIPGAGMDFHVCLKP